jgi:hypothetical protein
MRIWKPRKEQESRRYSLRRSNGRPARGRPISRRPCAEPALRREVESLIAAHEQAQTSFLAQPVAQPKEMAIGSRRGPPSWHSPIL